MIDMKLTYQTRDGRPVRILCTDSGHRTHPVLGIIGKHGYATNWMTTGEYNGACESITDLIEVKPRVVVERWINIVEFKTGTKVCIYPTAEVASLALTYEMQPGRILAEAVPFRWEGEGV